MKSIWIISYRKCRKIYSKGSQTLRRSADCNVTVLHCVVYITEYAKLLGKELNLPVHGLQQAKNKVLAGSEIIYLGWIMAGGIKGYKVVARRKMSIFTEFEGSYRMV